MGGHLVAQDTLAELGRPGAEDVDVVTEVAILARRIENAATPVLHLQASKDLTNRSCGVAACILAARHAAHVAVHCRPHAPADVERLRPLPVARPPGCVQRRACPHAVPSLSRSVPDLVLRDSPRLARTMIRAHPPERRTGSRRAVRSRSREPAAGVWRSICAGEIRTAPHGPTGAAMAVSDRDFAALVELSSDFAQPGRIRLATDSFGACITHWLSGVSSSRTSPDRRRIGEVSVVRSPARALQIALGISGSVRGTRP